MTETALSDRLHLRLRSRTPGRQRWESRHLVNREVAAKRLAMVVSGQRGVEDVEINVRTGRVSIVFAPGQDRDMAPLLRSSIFVLLFDPRTGAVSAKDTPGEDGDASARDLSALMRMFPPDKRTALSAPLWSLANNALNFAPELALVGIVNVVNGTTFGSLSAIGLTSAKAQVMALGVLAGGAFAAELGVERQRRRAWRKIANKAQHDIRTATYSHVQDLDMGYVDRRSSGELFNLINGNSGKIGKFLESGADDMFQRAVTAVVIVATLAAVSPVLALTTLAPLPVIALGSRTVRQKTGPLYQRMQKSEEGFSRFLSSNLGDLGMIKSFTTEEREARRMRNASERLGADTAEALQASSRYTDMMRLFISMAFAVAMVIGGMMVAGKSLTPATFTLILFFVPKLLMRMEGIGETFDQYQSATQASKSILSALRKQPSIVSGPVRLDPKTVEGRLSFENVTFSYDSERTALTEFSLDVPERSTVAFVGATGSGKSTVVKLLMRFYDPESGSVRLDGRDVRELNLQDLRRSIGFVSQDVFLADGSIYDNIAYGRPDATFQEVVEAAKAAEADSFIRELTGGYRAQVGERGRLLSGGQRQRVSIARAILKDPAIFVFDEATSAVDNETELAIQRSIQRVARERTTILIAHRLSTIRHADKIVVMEKGQIAEAGGHDELVHANGLYAALWRLQTGEMSLRAGTAA